MTIADKNKIDSLIDNIVSNLKIQEAMDKKFAKRIRLMPEIKKNYEFVAKDETSIEANYFCEGFVEGAEWRINKVWHPANEEPIKHICLLIIEGNNGEFDLGYTEEQAKDLQFLQEENNRLRNEIKVLQEYKEKAHRELCRVRDEFKIGESFQCGLVTLTVEKAGMKIYAKVVICMSSWNIHAV